MRRSRVEITPELRQMVSASGALLGEVIRRERGALEYRAIESLRRDMALLRGLSAEKAYQILARRFQALQKLDREQRRSVAHSFSLLLELMNACENAWRTHRLRQRSPIDFKQVPRGIVSVLTAHPTEARAPENVEIFHRIQELITEAFSKGAKGWRLIEERLEHQLELAWRVPIARNRRPTVEDEAFYIYSIVLKDETLEAILEANRTVPFYFRSWVGGDKDGHPGVTEVSTRKSLNASRAHLCRYALGLLKEVEHSLCLMPRLRAHGGLRESFKTVTREFRALKTVGLGDGKKISNAHQKLKSFSLAYQKEIHAPHPSLDKLRRLFRVFPALVIPLELRESSDELILAVSRGGAPRHAPKHAPRHPIERMLREIRAVSRGGNPRWYARGLVISMTRDFNDIAAACRLVKRCFGVLKLPVIPLFEQAAALDASVAIVQSMISDREIFRAIRAEWNGYLEVMLGYSDSAKEMGVLPSRLAISRAMTRLDRLCRAREIQPLFFHGAGGSVDRGGGSIEEQTAGWPESALQLYKVTVQGEMVERAFSTPEITHRQMEAVVRQWDARKSLRRQSSSGGLTRFSARVSKAYRAKIQSPGFLRVVEAATPYADLQKLRIGSRPSKRAGTLSVSSLRAIPWVLCWTQTRILFPTWWGVGTAWRQSSSTERRELARNFKTDALFRSYVKLLGFTLAKVELPIWRLYLEQSGLSRSEIDRTYCDFEEEIAGARRFFHAVSGERDLLWYREWLGESIRLRSPMIHPLNLLQIANRDLAGANDILLTRETVTGIASGMLTTG